MNGVATATNNGVNNSGIIVAAERSGKTAHAFILDAIAQTMEQAELDEAFNRVAGLKPNRAALLPGL